MSRLMDPRKKDGTFPFEYTNSTNTDIRKTLQKAKDKLQKKPEPKPIQSLSLWRANER